MELQREPEALSALERMGPEDAVPGAVLDLGSRCMVQVQAAPAFADGIERSEGTQLEASVKACLRPGFERLDRRHAWWTLPSGRRWGRIGMARAAWQRYVGW